MIGKVVGFLVTAAIILAAIRIFGSGGEIEAGNIFDTIWSFFYTIVTGMADFIVTAWNTVFVVTT